jgi:hypothetical protein
MKAYAMPILVLMIINLNQSLAQTMDYPPNAAMTAPDTNRKLFGGTITNSGYGGIILKFSTINNQFAFMTGGRGACTINHRFTLGGGGYGVANSISLPGAVEDTSRFFKMGYGGLELGYIIIPGKKVNIIGSLLIAAGAAFWQNDPKSDGEELFDDDFKMFPVLEPSLYGEVVLTRWMRLNAGISYRYINADLSYMKDQDMRGFSCYFGFIFGKS